MEILKKGTTVIMLDRSDDNYSVGTVIGAYSHSKNNDDYIFPPSVLYVVVDNEGKLHQGFNGIHFMTPEDYKEYLLAEINENNEQIRELSEDNDRISNLIHQVDEDVDSLKPICDEKTEEIQAKQRKFVPNTYKIIS